MSAETAQVVVGVVFVAVVDAAVSGQPGHGALDYPSSTTESLGGVDAFEGDADAEVLASQPSPQGRDVVRLVRVKTPTWNRSRGIRVPCVSGKVSASGRGCSGYWLRRVRRAGASVRIRQVLVQSSPYTGPGLDEKPALHGRLRRPEARWHARQA